MSFPLSVDSFKCLEIEPWLICNSQWWNCGTVGSLWLRLDNDVLPDVAGEQQQGLSFAGCEPEGWYTPVTVMNCEDFFVYFLNPTPLDSRQSYCVAIQT